MDMNQEFVHQNLVGPDLIGIQDARTQTLSRHSVHALQSNQRAKFRRWKQTNKLFKFIRSNPIQTGHCELIVPTACNTNIGRKRALY